MPAVIELSVPFVLKAIVAEPTVEGVAFGEETFSVHVFAEPVTGDQLRLSGCMLPSES